MRYKFDSWPKGPWVTPFVKSDVLCSGVCNIAAFLLMVCLIKKKVTRLHAGPASAVWYNELHLTFSRCVHLETRSLSTFMHTGRKFSEKFLYVKYKCLLNSIQEKGSYYLPLREFIFILERLPIRAKRVTAQWNLIVVKHRYRTYGVEERRVQCIGEKN
jgi:hypothetical protein